MSALADVRLAPAIALLFGGVVFGTGNIGGPIYRINAVRSKNSGFVVTFLLTGMVALSLDTGARGHAQPDCCRSMGRLEAPRTTIRWPLRVQRHLRLSDRYSRNSSFPASPIATTRRGWRRAA